MPIIEWECKSCTKITEVLQKAEDKLYMCPKCDSKDVKKLISVSTPRLHGEGVYNPAKTDFD